MSGAGIGLLFASAMCAVGNLVSHQVGAIVAAVLLALGVLAFVFRRASSLVEEIIEQEHQN